MTAAGRTFRAKKYKPLPPMFHTFGMYAGKDSGWIAIKIIVKHRPNGTMSLDFRDRYPGDTRRFYLSADRQILHRVLFGKRKAR